MKNPKYFVPAKFLLVFAISVLFLACKTMQPVSVTGIEDAKFSSITEKKTELEFSLKISNPNSFGFYIYKSEIDVKINEMSLGKAHLTQKVFIKANSESTYKFVVNSNSPQTIMGAATIVSVALKRSALIDLHGKIKAGRFPVIKKFPVTFKREVSLDTF
jgi:LEA14-like dessication related protein